jgi:heparin binding hemagglutinin HbhA
MPYCTSIRGGACGGCGTIKARGAQQLGVTWRLSGRKVGVAWPASGAPGKDTAMSEQQNPQAGDPSDQGQAKPDLFDELKNLGNQLENLFSSAVNSDKARALQQQFAQGVREIGTQVQAAVKNVQDNPKVHEFEERGRQALKEARESQLADKLQDAVVNGLQQINSQLSKLVETFKSEQAAPPSSGARSVTIEEDLGDEKKSL